jgi:hypothetical protein
MLVRLGFVVVASVAALTLKNRNSGARRNKGTALALHSIQLFILFTGVPHPRILLSDNGQTRERQDKTHRSEHVCISFSSYDLLVYRFIRLLASSSVRLICTAATGGERRREGRG